MLKVIEYDGNLKEIAQKLNNRKEEISIEVNNAVWSNNGKKLTMKLDIDFEVFSMEFNWWGLDKPLISKNGILLKPQSYILVKK